MLRLVPAEVEERLPADEPPARAGAAAQVDGVRLIFAGRVEDEPEERRAIVAGQVGAV